MIKINPKQHKRRYPRSEPI